MTREDIWRDRASVIVYGLLALSLLVYPDPLIAVLGQDVASYAIAFYCMVWFAYGARVWR